MKAFIKKISRAGLACIARDDRNKGGTAEYSCIDPALENDLLDYFNGALTNYKARTFEEHLFVCHKCQDKFLRLEAVFDVLEEEIIGSSGDHQDAGAHFKNAKKNKTTPKAWSVDRCHDETGEIRKFGSGAWAEYVAWKASGVVGKSNE